MIHPDSHRSLGAKDDRDSHKLGEEFMDAIAMPLAIFGFVMSLTALGYIGDLQKRIKALEAKLDIAPPKN
jgi:hypothetical protein